MTGLLIDQVINGIVAGAIYALMAAGLSLVYGTMRVLNLAQGEFAMLGGFAGVVLMEHLGLTPLLAVPIAVVLIGAVCAILQQAFVRPLMARPGADFGTIAVTLGLSVTLQNAAFHVWGERFQVLPYYVEGVVEVGGLFLPAQRLLILVAAVMALGGLAVMLQTTRFGRAVRATAQDGEAARVLGVPVERIHMAVFALAGGPGSARRLPAGATHGCESVDGGATHAQGFRGRGVGWTHKHDRGNRGRVSHRNYRERRGYLHIIGVARRNRFCVPGRVHLGEALGPLWPGREVVPWA